jgi:hypothetical protein
MVHQASGELIRKNGVEIVDDSVEIVKNIYKDKINKLIKE